ncbi:MAG: hypothetical protein NZO16_01820 [Deltaproteobacteria bacterium]|nr:hypothetical protein [Deltaproteobacteria bacterium]
MIVLPGNTKLGPQQQRNVRASTRQELEDVLGFFFEVVRNQSQPGSDYHRVVSDAMILIRAGINTCSGSGDVETAANTFRRVLSSLREINENGLLAGHNPTHSQIINRILGPLEQRSDKLVQVYFFDSSILVYHFASYVARTSNDPLLVAKATESIRLAIESYCEKVVTGQIPIELPNHKQTNSGGASNETSDEVVPSNSERTQQPLRAERALDERPKQVMATNARDSESGSDSAETESTESKRAKTKLSDKQLEQVLLFSQALREFLGPNPTSEFERLLEEVLMDTGGYAEPSVVLMGKISGFYRRRHQEAQQPLSQGRNNQGLENNTKFLQFCEGKAKIIVRMLRDFL